MGPTRIQGYAAARSNTDMHMREFFPACIPRGAGEAVVIQVAVCAALWAAPPALAAEQSPGQVEYEHKCARCHGATGRGDGWFVENLKQPPRSITRLARDNGGVFPADRVNAVIDGRAAVPIHGPRDMPVWGVFYRSESSRYDARYRLIYSDEGVVRERIKSLVEYISTLQE